MRSSIKFITILFICTSSFLLHCKTAKNHTNKSDTSSIKENTLENTKWLFQTINGENASKEKAHFTLDTASGKIQGNGGCNNFFGKYTLTEDSFNAPSIAVTRKMCMSIKYENQLLEVLSNATTYTINKGILTITAKNEVVAVFKAA